MKEELRKTKLLHEETKATKFFIWLFYIFFIIFEVVYFYIAPRLTGDGVITRPNDGIGLWMYVLIAGIFPVSYYLLKIGKVENIKYIYFFSFIFIDIINNLIIYLGTDESFAAGHIVEVLFILFLPIFVSKKYFWTVSSVVVLKYLFMGLVLEDNLVLVPIIIYMILSAIVYVILTRFYSYISSLNSAHEELRKKEKLAVIGQMAAAIGHEIRNPLSSLRGFTQLQQERNPDNHNYYPIMIQEIDRINKIVDDLMYLGKPRIIKYDKASIEEIIAYTLSITQHDAERSLIKVETIMEGPLPPIECDSRQLKQVFLNLIKNAIESMLDGGNIQIKVKVIDGKKMMITIRDEGCGIPDANLLNLGEPFFTTKMEGTGLGLMVTNQIINEHKGNLKFESSLDTGTTVTVVLPITQK
ncbi:ATP-binding protein [Bacillus sp. MRMR6]|uniref:ATP-binding protein n=1 Tax=Bacillus sp. MRMR6 TaxID=1928617 RepID=UPI00095131A7|nr:ATP-binding protein [Bacillus sp. MRMR6]OLS40487.1 two-component sensor histidine kinase [Bacillus sp. MRMR6]